MQQDQHCRRALFDIFISRGDRFEDAVSHVSLVAVVTENWSEICNICFFFFFGHNDYFSIFLFTFYIYNVTNT